MEFSPVEISWLCDDCLKTGYDMILQGQADEGLRLVATAAAIKPTQFYAYQLARGCFIAQNWRKALAIYSLITMQDPLRLECHLDAGLCLLALELPTSAHAEIALTRDLAKPRLMTHRYFRSVSTEASIYLERLETLIDSDYHDRCSHLRIKPCASRLACIPPPGTMKDEDFVTLISDFARIQSQSLNVDSLVDDLLLDHFMEIIARFMRLGNYAQALELLWIMSILQPDEFNWLHGMQSCILLWQAEQAIHSIPYGLKVLFTENFMSHRSRKCSASVARVDATYALFRHFQTMPIESALNYTYQHIYADKFVSGWNEDVLHYAKALKCKIRETLARFGALPRLVPRSTWSDEQR